MTPEELKRIQLVYKAETDAFEAQRNVFSVPPPKPQPAQQSVVEAECQRRLNAGIEDLLNVFTKE